MYQPPILGNTRFLRHFHLQSSWVKGKKARTRARSMTLNPGPKQAQNDTEEVVAPAFHPNKAGQSHLSLYLIRRMPQKMVTQRFLYTNPVYPGLIHFLCQQTKCLIFRLLYIAPGDPPWFSCRIFVDSYHHFQPTVALSCHHPCHHHESAQTGISPCRSGAGWRDQ